MSCWRCRAWRVFGASCALAQDKPAAQSPPGTESLETVKKEFESARDAYLKELEAALDEARKNGKEKEFNFDKQPPRLRFSPRSLLSAKKNPEGPEAIDAVKMTLQRSNGVKPYTALETRAKAVKVHHDYCAASCRSRHFSNCSPGLTTTIVTLWSPT